MSDSRGATRVPRWRTELIASLIRGLGAPSAGSRSRARGAPEGSEALRLEVLVPSSESSGPRWIREVREEQGLEWSVLWRALGVLDDLESDSARSGSPTARGCASPIGAEVCVACGTRDGRRDPG